MRYVEYHRQGYQIGSGMIENAAKQIGIMSMMVLGAIWNEVKACKVAKAKASYLEILSNVVDRQFSSGINR